MKKYSQRLRELTNIVVLKPEIARAFPNQKAGNSTLLSLTQIAKKTKLLASSQPNAEKTACLLALSYIPDMAPDTGVTYRYVKSPRIIYFRGAER